MAIARDGKTVSHVAVRMPFSDLRAEKFIGKEAKQLPDDAPGLIVVDVSKAIAAIKAWEPLIMRRFQPSIHTRVGGVCLVSSGIDMAGDGGGLSLSSSVKFIANPHAKFSVPSWVEAALA